MTAASCLAFLLGLFLLAPADLASVVSLTLVLRLLLYKTLASDGATDDVGVGSREAWARIQYYIYGRQDVDAV